MQQFHHFRRTGRFKRSWKTYIRKNPELKTKVESTLRKFAQNPELPGLHIKKIRGTDNLWEMSVDRNIRIVWFPKEETAVLLDIGPPTVDKFPE